jgi:transcriptional regulator with XRE-family HTH domain/DNA-directed RNA polymerase subunit RPC12/RpoP
MDIEKTGKLIAEERKKKKLTQQALAAQLHVSDRAVSKWERGVNLPDASLMGELCRILGIRINDLFSGEVLPEEAYQSEAEKNLLLLESDNEATAKSLLLIELVVGFSGTLSGMLLVLAGALAPLEMAWRIALLVVGFIVILIAAFSALLLEQKAGYYECPHCHTRYIPSYHAMLFAMHTGRTRYLRCPHCGRRGWQKKVTHK